LEADLLKLLEQARRTWRGKINREIDKRLHPFFKRFPGLILVDGVLHALNEYPALIRSWRKFQRYNVPRMFEVVEEWLKKGNNR